MPNIDWDFIERLEGQQLRGYVPCDKSGTPLGHSGVTVGAGVDLGQRDEYDLGLLALPAALQEKLIPYCGQKGQAALDLVRSYPLWVSQEEADHLNRAVRNHAIEGLAAHYDQTEGSVGMFDDLPPAVQTVLASVAFQYGANLNTRCPKFWNSIIHNDWDAVIAELRNFGDAYRTRRLQEADYLSKNIGAA